MKLNRFFVTSLLLISNIVMLAVTAVTFFLNRTVFWVELAACAVVLIISAIRLYTLQKQTARYLHGVAQLLDEEDREALQRFPFPVLVLSELGTVEWYSDLCRDAVLEGREVYGMPVSDLLGGVPLKTLARQLRADVTVGVKRYDVCVSPLEKSGGWALYFVENTALKETADEYAASRPVVMLVYIDSIDELMKDVRESDRAQMAGMVEKLLEDWVGETSGILRKLDSDRFIVLLEHRHLLAIIERRFDILDRVRTVEFGGRVGVTLSIGVGEGKTLHEGEEQARQALEMALGRGGDQAAVRTSSGYDFFGGRSRGVERRAKVRPRVIAKALTDLIHGNDMVFVMGHKFSDLDCLGSACALTVAVRHMGKIAYVVVDRQKSLAPELIARYEKNGFTDLFLSPQEATEIMGRRALVIVTDTHNPQLVESLPLCEAANQVVVIDHHRRMASQIESAVIFYHEANASSASEMVAELVQYMPESRLSAMDAEALLAGIMLDTRNFVMKAGARTFEAAGYLRSMGADTVAVKRLFSGSMEQYRLKSEIVACAAIYRDMAIAVSESIGPDIRVAAAQAADELLSISGVKAAFTMFSDNGTVNLSARSYGDVNVQLVAESLGGGGHLTMAGAQLRDSTLEQALERLHGAIDQYLKDNT